MRTRVGKSDGPVDRTPNRGLNIEEVRLVSDLRVMHSKVDELYYIVSSLKRRHDERVIYKYADAPVLAEDITRVDQIYMWFVALKEERERASR